MTYQLSPEIDQRIQSQLARGIYSTPAEVLTSPPRGPPNRGNSNRCNVFLAGGARLGLRARV
jgi:hypothetical protein